MSELRGNITLSYRQNKDTYKHDLYIMVKDNNSQTKIVQIKVDSENVSEVFGGLAEVPVTYEPCLNPERLGKTKTHFKVTLPVPTSLNKKAMARSVINSWHKTQLDKELLFPSYYLDSQDSFTHVSDGNYNVTFTVCRYD